MIKKLFILSLSGILLFPISFYASEEKITASEMTQMEHSVTFTDDLGREVSVSNPERVAALIGSHTDIWFLAGGTKSGKTSCISTGFYHCQCKYTGEYGYA